MKRKREEELERETQHIKTVLEELLPDKLLQHDLEVRDRYRSDRESYLHDIKNETLRDLQNPIDEILKIERELKEELEKINRSTKDMLRQRIMHIYDVYKEEQKIPLTVRENLDELYNDYIGQGGNSYVTKYYKRMLLWEIVNDIQMEDDE